MIYIIVFLISIYFSHIASNCFNRRSKMVGFFLSTISIFAPVLLAGMRDYTVGTDTINYTCFFENACSCRTFKEFIVTSPSVELGYLTFTYLFSRLCHETWLYFATFHLLIIVPVYWVGYKNRGRVSLPLMMFVFLFLFYNESLNITRQYVSISLGLVAIWHLIQGNFKSSVAFTVIAISFHTSSILLISYYLVYYVTNRYPLRGNLLRYLLYIVLFVAVFGTIVNFGLLNIAYSITDRFSNYASSDKGTVSNSTMILYLLTSFTMFVAARSTKDVKITFFFVLSSFAMFFLLAGSISNTFYRLALPFAFPLVYSFPYLCKSISDKGKKIIGIGGMSFYFAFFLFYWYFVIVLRGSFATYPYSSTIL